MLETDRILITNSCKFRERVVKTKYQTEMGAKNQGGVGGGGRERR